MMEREKLVENFFMFFPVMFKKLTKGVNFPSEIPKQGFELLFIINNEDCNTMSYYSNKIMISKPNLTVIADKLIEEKLIERFNDPNDRRVIMLKITDKGREFLKKHKERVKSMVLKKFEMLTDDEVKRLNEIVNEMRTIFKTIIDD